MSIRFISPPASGRVALAVTLLSLCSSAANAQSAAPAPPAAAMTAVAPAAFRSAFEGYQPYTDEKMLPWKQANDAVGQIGGWREYAKEAGRPGPPAQAGDGAAKTDPKAGNAKPGRTSP